MTNERPLHTCSFKTARLVVGDWHAITGDAGIDLPTALSSMLTQTTTRALPSAWRGDFSVDRAQRWITERDGESPTLLVIDQRSNEPVGLVILFDTQTEQNREVDVRIGYLLAESAWGNGLATELVRGLVSWARSERSIRCLVGGVARHNVASARVLTKNGFSLSAESSHDQHTYELLLRC
jgi:ribosomal-protein-alanine N-acetyltransferase